MISGMAVLLRLDAARGQPMSQYYRQRCGSGNGAIMRDPYPAAFFDG
jgi:hypothetical protein